MCFALYLGTSKPLATKEWRDETPDLTITPLSGRETPISLHFTKPHVHYIGSTSGCGCNFPYVDYQNGEWSPYQRDPDDESAGQKEAAETDNRQRLVRLLQETGEYSVELYGVWEGNFGLAPVSRETIAVKEIMNDNFRFKERGLYRVRLADDAD